MTPLERAGFLAHARTRAFARRLDEANAVIERVLTDTRNPYVGYSTGKDSEVVLDLVWRQAPTVPAIYFDADCAFPESRARLDVLIAAGRPVEKFPCRPFLDILAAAGGPDAPGVEDATMWGTVYEPVRRLLAERYYDAVVLGLRGDESPGRRMLVRTRGLLFFNQREGIREALPVGRWTHDDIWAYLVSRNVDYNRAYDVMGDRPARDRRISYWAGETNRRHGRWAYLKLHYPDLWQQFLTRFPEVGLFA